MFTCFASINSTCDSKINKNNLFILHTFLCKDTTGVIPCQVEIIQPKCVIKLIFNEFK